MPRVKRRSAQKVVAATDHAALLKLYEQTTLELQKLREFEWKVAATFVTFSGAFIALVLTSAFQEILRIQALSWIQVVNPIRVGLTVVQVAVLVFGLWCLGVTHGYLTVQRGIRRDIETTLRFHEPGVFCDEPVLPVQFAAKVGFGFQAAGLLIPLATLVVVVQLFSVYLVWAVK